jgi:protease IV
MQMGKLGRGLSWVIGGGLVFLGVLFMLSLYMAKRDSGSGKIGLIRLEGAILDSRETLEQLDKHQNNEAIKALVVRINSPGGGVAAAQEIYEEFDKIRSQRKKPVIVSMGSLAASGGYYVACASDRIFANPGSITGSIGVIMQLANVSGLLDKVGIRSVTIKSGEHKDMGSMTKEMSPEDRKIFQEVLDDAHDQFIEAVVRGRKMDKGKVREIADGRIFTGRQALGLGLVDELGDLSDAIAYAARVTGIRGRPKIVEEKKRKFLLGMAGSRVLSFLTAQTSDPIAQPLSIYYLMR